MGTSLRIKSLQADNYSQRDTFWLQILVSGSAAVGVGVVSCLGDASALVMLSSGVLVSLLLLLKSKKFAGLVLLTGALLFPYINVLDIQIRFELVYVLVVWLMFVSDLLMEGRRELRFNRVLKAYIAYLMIVAIASFAAVIKGGTSDSLRDVSIYAYGLVRPAIIMILFMNLGSDEKFIGKSLWIFIVISIILNSLTLMQFFNVAVATDLTRAFYSSDIRTPITRMLEEQGYLFRGVSVFESPVYNGLYCLIVMVIAINMMFSSRNNAARGLLVVSTILAILAGLATVSVTFLVGVFVVMIVFLINYVVVLRRMTSMRAMVLWIGSIIFVVITGFSLVNYDGAINYQVERIASFELLRTRYDAQSGILSDSYAAILESPLIGYGVITPEGSFKGDSLYIVLLLQGGIVGLVLYLIVIYLILMWSWKFKVSEDNYGLLHRSVMQMTMVLLLAGIGSPSFNILRMQDWYWGLVGICAARPSGVRLYDRTDV